MLHCFRKLKIISIVFLAAILLFILPGCSRQNDLSGTWKGKITLPQTGKSLTDLEFSLTQKGKDVTGMMIFTKPGAKLPLTGTVTDGKVTLSSPLKNGLSVSINGVLESRRLMRGTAILNYSTPQLGKRQDTTILELTR
jgi:hypothetical protein